VFTDPRNALAGAEDTALHDGSLIGHAVSEDSELNETLADP
jgi:hypothetical protein